MLLFESSSLYPMVKSGFYFLAGASLASAASFVVIRIRDKRQNEERRVAAVKRQRAREEQQKLTVAAMPTSAAPPAAFGLQPKAELLVSAGPRKSTRETELGEDIAGTVVTAQRIFFWVLDGTSDTVVIPGEQGRDLFSSRLFCLAISASLHQLAHKYTSAFDLAEAALENAVEQLKNQLAQHQEAFQRFGETEPAQTPHWDVSTTMLLGILSESGELDLFRIGDSKAISFGLDKQVISTVIDQKPTSIGLGRIHARLVRGEAYTLEVFPPDRPEQLHQSKASGIRRVIAFSDGVGPSTEQYLRRMLSQRTYDQFHDELARTPNKTFDDKTLVLASFEPMS
jgi:serine/threonine protein phosphatase PrpC